MQPLYNKYSLVPLLSSILFLHHHRCYLLILLILGSSTEPSLFHVGCRPSLHVGLFQHLYLINTWYEEWLIISIWSTHDAKIDTALTSNQHMMRRIACPALTSDLLIRKAHPTLTSDHVGTNPIIISKSPSTYIWSTHDRRKASTSLSDQHMMRR